MATSRRVERVQREAMRVLGNIVTTEVKDDRIADALISVTRTKVSPDLSVMHVWFAIVGDLRTQRGLLSVLERARPFLRRRLGEELQLRVVPDLKLHLDDGPNHAARIDSLLDEIQEEREARARVSGEFAATPDGDDLEGADAEGADDEGADDEGADDEGADDEDADDEGADDEDADAGDASPRA